MSTSRAGLRNRTWRRWGVVALGYAVGSVLALPFAMIVLAVGLSALGFETGWWRGDSNMNDGEGVPLTMLGLLVLGGFAAGTAWGATEHLRDVEPRRAARWVPIAASAALVACAIGASVALLLDWYPPRS